MFCAGTLFWKWALSPKNPRTDYLEVAVPDPTFTDIVAPGAKTALDWAKKSSPAQNCQKVRNAGGHPIFSLPDCRLVINSTVYPLEPRQP